MNFSIRSPKSPITRRITRVTEMTPEKTMNTVAFEQSHVDALVKIPVNGIALEGMLVVPARAKGVVLFAHGSGSSRLSPRNNFVAQTLHEAAIATLLMDLLTTGEDLATGNRFDIDLLTWRLERATRWVMEHPLCAGLDVGYFGASTGAAAALNAAGSFGALIGAVVSRGGRPAGPGAARPRQCPGTDLTHRRRFRRYGHRTE